MNLDPTQSYADILPGEDTVARVFSGVSEIPDLALQGGRRIVLIPAGTTVNVGDAYHGGAFVSPGTFLVIDESDVTKYPKAWRALGQLIAQYTGKTLAQVASDFKTIYNSLT